MRSGTSGSTAAARGHPSEHECGRKSGNMERYYFDPHEVPTPAGADGWEELYPPHTLFDKKNEEAEDSTLWFQLSLQIPFVLYPVDVCFGIVRLAGVHGYVNALLASSGSDESRAETRILNGYLYACPRIRRNRDARPSNGKSALFRERFKFFLDNWDELWRKWTEKNVDLAEKIEKIEWPELAVVEEWETGGPQCRLWGKEYVPSGLALFQTWHALKRLAYERLYVHFDLLDVSFLSYFEFREYCLKTFPNARDVEIANMLAGVQEPHLESELRLRELADFAVELGIYHLIKQPGPPEAILSALAETQAGKKWLAKWDDSKKWLHLTDGNGMYHKHVSWLEDLSIPFTFIRKFIAEIEAGGTTVGGREERSAEATRLFEAYRELLPTETDRTGFTNLWQTTRKTAIAMEGHAYYNDHWIYASVCRKLRELGRYLRRYGVLQEEEDIFLLYDFEIDQMLPQIISDWYARKDARSWLPPFWGKIAKRKSILKVLEAYTPPPLLIGTKALRVKGSLDPGEIVFRGFTNEKLENLFQPPLDIEEIRGIGASPGVCEGKVRVIRNPVSEPGNIDRGEILVTSFFPPAQAIAFEKIKGLVTDWGGIISHPAIMAREYGVPAVVGAAIATSILKDGMTVRLDGTLGTITIVHREPGA